MQAQRSKQQQDVTTLKASVACMKNSLRIAFSTVAYQRGLFPQDAFTCKEYCGTNLMLLNPKSAKYGSPEADRLSGASVLCDYLENGIFDAFEKRYVERIMFNIHNVDPSVEGNGAISKANSIVECYSFKIDYEHDMIINESNGNISKTKKGLMTRESVSNQTRAMIRKLTSLMSGLPTLDGEHWLTIYLSYNSQAPPDYEPPSFEATDFGEVPMFNSEPLTYSISKTATGYHGLELKVRYCQAHASDDDDEEDEKQPLLEQDPKGKDENDWQHIPDSLQETKLRGDDSTFANGDGELALADWTDCREKMYAWLRNAVMDHPESDPMSLLDKSEWGYSLSRQVKQDFVHRLQQDLGPDFEVLKPKPSPTPEPATVLQEIAIKNDIMQCSQNSFEGDRENIPRISKGKRSVHCVEGNQTNVATKSHKRRATKQQRHFR